MDFISNLYTANCTEECHNHNGMAEDLFREESEEANFEDNENDAAAWIPTIVGEVLALVKGKIHKKGD